MRLFALTVFAAAAISVSRCGEGEAADPRPAVPTPVFQEPTEIEEETEMLKLDGILEGEIAEQSSPDTTLRTIGLVLSKGGQRKKIANGNLSISANASGNPRVDMIQWNGVTLSVKAGTAAADPACPTPDAGNIPIAVVYVPTGFTSARSLGTLTVQAVMIAVYSATRGLWACTIRLSAAQNIAGASNVEFTGVSLPVYIPKGGAARYRFGFTANATFNDANGQMTVRFNMDGADESPGVALHEGDVGSAGQIVRLSLSGLLRFGIGNGQADIPAGAHRFKVYGSTSGAADDVDVTKHYHTIEQVY